MLIATITAYLFVSRVQQPIPAGWSKRNEVPGYRVAYSPDFLKGMNPTAVTLDSSVVRGFIPILSNWVVKKPLVKVAREVMRDLAQDRDVRELTDKQIESRGSICFTKELKDRFLKFHLSAGRAVVKKTATMTSYEISDQATYTRVQVTESPLYYGSKPSVWPLSAQRYQPLPPSFPSLPFTGIYAKPTSWSTSETPIGSTQYWVNWYLEEDAAVLVPRLARELQVSQDWKLSSPVKENRARFRPVNKKGGYVWLILEPVNTGRTRICVSWVDASKGLSGSLKSGTTKFKLRKGGDAIFHGR